MLEFNTSTEVMEICDVAVAPEKFVQAFDAVDVFHPSMKRQITWRGLPTLWDGCECTEFNAFVDEDG